MQIVRSFTKVTCNPLNNRIHWKNAPQYMQNDAEVKTVWLLFLNNSKGCDQKSADLARPH